MDVQGSNLGHAEVGEEVDDVGGAAGLVDGHGDGLGIVPVRGCPVQRFGFAD